MKILKMTFIGLGLVGFLAACDGPVSSEKENHNEALSLTSELVSSDSKLGSVSSIMSSFNVVGGYKAIDMLQLNESRLMGVDYGAIIFPWSDVANGGNSYVLDKEGAHLGLCPIKDSTCLENWNIGGAFVEVDWAPHHLSSELKITDYAPSSKEGVSWAEAGWWVILNYDKSLQGETPFDNAKPMGLTDGSWIRLEVNYEKGEILTIEFKGEDIDQTDIKQSPPRFSYVGKGYFEVINFPVSSVKRAGWLNLF